MSELIVFCTCANEEEASRIASTIVEERLAACVNLLPPVRSIYRWEGKVETASEILLLIKTSEERLAALEDRVHAMHSYEVPEMIAVPIVSGSAKYLDWLREQVR